MNDTKVRHLSAEGFHSGQLIVPADNLPKEMKSAKVLTLDQIDARDVAIAIEFKKKYQVPRARIVNKVITLRVSPSLPIPVFNLVLRLAVEARRRLRHPLDVAYSTPIEGIAWGELQEKTFNLDVKIEGQLVLTVSPGELPKPETEPEKDPGTLIR